MRKEMKKIATGVLFVFTMMLFAVVLSNCGNDEEGEKEPASLAGKYTFKKAVLTSDLTVQDATDGSTETIDLPAGYDVTNMVVGGIVGAVQCDDMANAAIDLRADHTLHAFCNGEGGDSMSGGTWSENATRTVLTLNLAPPLIPVPITIEETNIVVAGNNLSGNVAGMPMSGQLMEVYLDPTIIPEGFKFPVFLTMDVKIEYTKIN